MAQRMRIVWSLGSSVCLISTLTACEHLDRMVTPTPAPPQNESAARTSSGQTSPRVDLSTVAVPRPRPGMSPDAAIGVSGPELRALLGDPHKVTEAPPAIVWDYEFSTCSLSLFFYMDVNSNDYRVLTYEVKPEEAKEKCVATIDKRQE